MTSTSSTAKFGSFMKGISKKASKQMDKSMVRARQMAVERIAHAETTPEEPEVIAALERLKVTKNEMYQISEIVRNLYDARLNETTYLFQLAQRLSKVNVTENDAFGAYVQQMGQSLHKLEKVANTHLKKMKEEFVEPLEKFRDIDVENVQKLKLKYKTGKMQYDLELHRLANAKEGQDQKKVQLATQKRDAAYAELTALRNQLKFQVNNLEQKKQVGLLGNLEHYWESYSSFAFAQANILNDTTIERQRNTPSTNSTKSKTNNNYSNNKAQAQPHAQSHAQPTPQQSQQPQQQQTQPPTEDYSKFVEYTDMNVSTTTSTGPVPKQEDEYEAAPRYDDDGEEDDNPDGDFNPFAEEDD